ncbi:MAG: two-component regulator propeller domain-containing protein [Fidelibacterota bacterium]
MSNGELKARKWKIFRYAGKPATEWLLWKYHCLTRLPGSLFFTVLTDVFLPMREREYHFNKLNVYNEDRQLRVKILLVSVFLSAVFSQTPSLTFNHLTVDNGLSQNSVNCILEDRNGFIWFGTKDGLNRYDGYDFKIYKHISSDKTSISDNFIMSLFEDESGNLWVGTENGGLNRYDPYTETFHHYFNDPDDPASLGSNEVWSIDSDQSGNLWIGTKRGLSRLNTNTGMFTNYRSSPETAGLSDNHIRTVVLYDEDHILLGTDLGRINIFNPGTEEFLIYPFPVEGIDVNAHNPIQDLLVDSHGSIWVCTGNGVSLFDLQSGKFQYYQLFSPGDGNQALTIQEDGTGYLWVGNSGGGLARLNLKSGGSMYFHADPNNPYSLNDSGVRHLYIDSNDLLWVGYKGAGVSFTNSNSDFRYYTHIPSDPNSLSSYSLRGIFESADGSLWIGSYSGLDYIDPSRKTVINYQPDLTNLKSLRNKNVYSIIEDYLGFLWVGTEGGGLHRFDRKTQTFHHFGSDPDDPYSTSDPFIYVLFIDKQDNLWIGTENGLNRFDRASGTFQKIMHDPENSNSLIGNTIRAITEDPYGNIWIGTNSGISQYFVHQGKFRNFTQLSDTIPLSVDRIKSLKFDDNGILWVGTDGGGLNRLDPIHNTLYQISQGLPNDVIYGILDDHAGNLWLSTNNGLVRFEVPHTFPVENVHNLVRTFRVADGVQGKEFNTGSYFQSTSGEMFFGGINGLTAFYPHEIEESSRRVPMVITNLKIFNNTVHVGEEINGNIILLKNINETDHLALSYREYQFTFEFAAIDILSSKDVMYSYLLEGFDENPIVTTAQNRIATFTNVPAGNYRFRLKAYDLTKNLESEERIIAVKITPPLWKTWWAYSLYFLFFLGLSTGTVFWRTNALKHRTLLLERLVKDRTEEIRKNEKLLKTQYTFLNTVIESLTHPFYVLDAQTKKIVIANAAARKESDLENITCHAMSNKADGLPCSRGGLECPVPSVMNTRKPVKTEIKYSDKSGADKFAEVNAYPIFNERGTVIQVIEYYLDVTDRKELENSLKYNLEQRNKELTSIAMRMAQDKESLVGIIKDLQELYLQSKQTEKQSLKNLMNRLQNQIQSGSEWDEFELWFKEVHKEFYEKLHKDYPDLSSREIKICAFLRLNLNTKEIASITNLTIKTIEVYRSNIRKKLNLSQGENLSIFLARL